MKTVEYMERTAQRRHAVNADASMTSPAMGLGSWFMAPMLGKHSTTPAKAYEHVSCFIVGGGVALRGELFGRDWILEATPPVLEGVSVMEFAAPVQSLPQSEAATDVAKDVQWLRSSLELSMVELGALFGAKTRKAVYDWLAGTKTSKAAYIRAVRNLFEGSMPSTHLPYLRQFWDSTPANGEPLNAILKSGEPNRLSDARVALAALQVPIADYVRHLAPQPHFNASGSADTDDIYRST